MGRDGHYSNEIMKQFQMKEQHTKTKEKEFGWLSEGKIQEEAETILGGRGNLEAAVRRGAVTVSVQSGIQLFHIPTAQAVLKDKFQHAVGTEGNSAINEEVHEAMRSQGASMPTLEGPTSTAALPSFPSSPPMPSSSCMSSMAPSCAPLPLTLATPSLDGASVCSPSGGHLPFMTSPRNNTNSALVFNLGCLNVILKKTIKGLKNRVGEESLSPGLTAEQIKALTPKVKKCEQVLKMGTNQVEIAEQLDHDIVKEHVHRLRDQLFHLDRLHSSARFCEWSTTEIVFFDLWRFPQQNQTFPKNQT